MSHRLTLPWNNSKNEDKDMIRTAAKRIILSFICKQHRYYNNKWAAQHTNNLPEIQELVQKFSDFGMYTTNRREQLTIALQCLYIFLKQTPLADLGSSSNCQLLEMILQQLETKFCNRFFHEFKVYRHRKILRTKLDKRQRTLCTRVYLLEHQHYPLKCDYTTEIQPELDYNFTRDTTLSKSILITGFQTHSPLLHANQNRQTQDIVKQYCYSENSSQIH